jgi:repressor LexA
MPESLTAMERQVYHFLLDFLAENTYQPSVREIGRRFRIKSTKTVAEILQALAEKGYIERKGARSRAVRIIGFSSIGRTQPVPLYDGVSAGEPRLRDEHRVRFISMDRSFVPSDDAFFLRVADDAMLGHGIQRGDLVMVNPSARARDGEAVAARVGAQSLVRTLSHRGARVVLSPASVEVPELTVGPSDDFAILGVIAAVLRPFHDRTESENGEGA